MKQKPKERFQAFMALTDFELDRYGHYQKDAKDVISDRTKKPVCYKIRIKMQTTSVRYEIKRVGDTEWMPSSSAYYKDITYSDDGLVATIGRRIVKRTH